MRTLITGANGFIARHLARVLRRIGGGRIAGLDIRPGGDAPCDEWYTADLTDLGAARAALASVRPDSVYHLVGLLRGSDRDIIASNVTTSANLLTAARQVVPHARLVVVGSAAEYGVVPEADQPVAETFRGVPTTSYGRAKQQVTALALAAVKDYGQHVTVARPFNVLGPGVPDGLVAGAIVSRLRAAMAGPAPRSIRIGRTSAMRDFVAVEDVAEGLVRLGGAARPGHCYNLCSGQGHTIAEVLERLLAEVREPISVDCDETLLRTGDPDRIVGSRAKAERELGWRPAITFEDSLHAAWEASGSPPG